LSVGAVTAAGPNGCASGARAWSHDYAAVFATEPVPDDPSQKLGATVTGASGRIHLGVSVLHPCSYATADATGTTYVWGANIGQNGGLVQFGVGQCSAPFRWLCNSGGNGRLRFIWTPTDGQTRGDETGVINLASWIPIEPAAGHDYEFAILATDTLVAGRLMPIWRFSLTDLTDGAGPFTTDIHRHWATNAWGEGMDKGTPLGNHAWYGFETTNTHDAQGTYASEAPIVVYAMRLRRVGDPTWHQLTGLTKCVSDETLPQYHCAPLDWTGKGDAISVYSDGS
jgi:hypothetical protein